MNDANQANFDEINGHIQIIKAKMGNVGGTTAKLIEDLEDYYERGMQLRVMHNTTLTSELEDERKQNVSLRHRNRLLIGLWLALVFVFGLFLMMILCPQCLRRALSTRFVQQALPLVVVAGISSVVTFIALNQYFRGSADASKNSN